MCMSFNNEDVKITNFTKISWRLNSSEQQQGSYDKIIAQKNNGCFTRNKTKIKLILLRGYMNLAYIHIQILYQIKGNNAVFQIM